MTSRPKVTAAILAGGKGRRLGGADKGLMEFAGKPMIEHILAGIRPQCDAICINANRNQDRYAQYGYPVLHDVLADFQGPLAGFSTALAHAEPGLVATLPCDTPHLPADLVQRLWQQMDAEQADIAVAHDGTRLQPIYALIKTDMADSLHRYLAAGDRKIDLWYAQNNSTTVDFADVQAQFQNINTPEDRQQLEQGGTV